MTEGVSRRRLLAATPGMVVAGAALTPSQSIAEAPSGLAHLVPSETSDDAYWLKVRREFNVRDRIVWLNTGTFGPSPRIVPETNARVAREQAEDPAGSSRAQQREAVRGKIATLIGAHPDECIITRSTTEGVNIFAHGLDWRAGDEVVIANHEHPGGLGVYQTLSERYGIRLRWVEIPAPPESPEQLLDLYRKAMTRRTRVVFSSHVMFANGTLMPVRALADMAHSKGALISIDGAHSAGALQVDVRAMDCDHYAAAGQKWLMAGSGTGLSYIPQRGATEGVALDGLDGPV